MEPLSALLMGGTALSNLATGTRANRNAEENLAFQKWLANEEMRMGQASRQDAYGNTVRYDKALNKWVTDLSPYQNQLAKAGEHEQFLNLTSDAARNRQVRERAFQRGQDAGEDYNRASAGYRYDQGPSEGAIRNELTDLILKARGTSGGSGAQNFNNYIRQRGNLPVVSSGVGRGSAVSDIAEAMLQARSGALGERGQRNQQAASKYLPAMQHFGATMDAGGGNTPINFPNFDYLNKNQAGQSDDALKAMATAGKGVEGAYGNLTNASKLNMINPAQYATFLRGGATGKSPAPIASSTTADNRSLDDIMYGF
jgi:hypothetical protein